MALSEHFTVGEFELDAGKNAIPVECLPIFTRLCQDILEPIREKFGCSVVITSGFRTREHNAEVHGQVNSEHIATEDYCAADFIVMRTPARTVFDWMRLHPTLPFHQLIYETDRDGAAVVHVSINRLKPGVRSVLTGATHNAERYVAVDHAPFNPPSNIGDVETASAEG